MAHTAQPYVHGGNKKHHKHRGNYATQQPQNAYNAPVRGSAYVPSSSTGYNNSYNSSSAYAPSPSGGGYTSSPTQSSSRAPGMSSLPDFSQALNFLPPKLASSLGPSSSSSSQATTQGYNPGYAGSTSQNTPQGKYGAAIASLAQGFLGSKPNTPSQPTFGSSAVPVNNTGGGYYSGDGNIPSQPMYNSAVAVPVNNTGGYYANTQPSQPVYGSAVAVPVNKTDGYYSGDGKMSGGGMAVSGLNSSTYTGGPTGGLISEGNPTICHKVDYEIKGHEMQLVEIELDPQETVIAEAGALMYMEDGIDFKTKFGDGSEPKQGFFKKLMSAGGRLLMGESLFITHFTNQGQSKARVAFAAPFPGSILPINLQNIGGKIICEKDAFLCAAKGTKLSVHLHKKFGSGLFGGEGFILQKLQGDGMAFIHAGGMVIRRELHGEMLRIDTGCIVAFTEGINFDIQFVPGLKTMFFGGEGLFLATLQGTGTVWLQSLPFSRFADRVIQYAPSIGGRRQGEGSALTGRYGDIVNGGGLGFKF